jgi:anti-sigma regulatory factor (Ser/Thr protein kinase)
LIRYVPFRMKRGHVRLVRVVQAELTAPGEARRSLRALEGWVAPNQLDDLTLVVSELVTNSVVHSGLTVGASITMVVDVSPKRVRIEVIDHGHGLPDAAQESPTDHGRGLVIVDRLADRWGTEHQDETTVWAEFALRS